MNAINLLEDLSRRGVEIETDGMSIHLQGTMEPLAPEMIDALKQHKQEIIKVLTSYGQELVHELVRAGLAEKWRKYLLERVEILIQHEGYSSEVAQEEVIKMIPYYRELN